MRRRNFDLTKAQEKLARFREENKTLFDIVRNQPRCVRCGRALSDPESVARGIGPECAEKAKTVEENL